MTATLKPRATKQFDKLDIVARKGASPTRIRRFAKCLGTCGRTEATTPMLTALVAASGYGRRALCLDCLRAATKPAGYWPSVHGKGQGGYEWRVEVRPFGNPAEQPGVTLALFEAAQWYPCQTGTEELVWRTARPSIKWGKLWDSLDFQGMTGKVTVWCRRKDSGSPWLLRATFNWRDAEHTREVLMACKF